MPELVFFFFLVGENFSKQENYVLTSNMVPCFYTVCRDGNPYPVSEALASCKGHHVVVFNVALPPKVMPLWQVGGVAIFCVLCQGQEVLL